MRLKRLNIVNFDATATRKEGLKVSGAGTDLING